MEETKKNEQESLEINGKDEKMGKMEKIKSKVLFYMKKPWVITVLAMLFATIIAISFVFCGTSRKETTNYLGDSCYVPFGEMIVVSVSERDYYVTEDNAFVQAPSGKKVIQVYGQINNVSGKKQSLSSNMFRLNPSESQEYTPKSHAFVDRYSSHFGSVTLSANGVCQFYMYYIVGEGTKVEDCRLIVYSAVVAFIEEPASAE